MAYVSRHVPVIEGTSGVRRMSIEKFDDVRVNGSVINDPRYQVKPGDVVQARDYLNIWHTYIVTADQIESTW